MGIFSYAIALGMLVSVFLMVNVSIWYANCISYAMDVRLVKVSGSKQYINPELDMCYNIM